MRAYAEGPIGPCYSIVRVVSLNQGTTNPWKQYSEDIMNKLIRDIVNLKFLKPTIEIPGRLLSSMMRALTVPNPVDRSGYRSGSADWFD